MTRRLPGWFAVALLVSGVFAGCDEHVPAAPPSGANPVQNEMRLLHEAARDWVTAVSYNTLETIPKSVERIHAARALTEAALETGQYKPPRNGAALDEFKRTDEAFHGELVKLVEASNAKDLQRSTHQLGVVLDSCTGCHQKFRF